MDVCTALLTTEAVIQKYGWRKDSFGSVADGFCLMGALKFAIIGSPKLRTFISDEQWELYLKAVSALHRTKSVLYPKHQQDSVPMWNDMADVTEKEVKRLIRRTIAALITIP